MDRLKFATTWLGGCSGCHMSFLDLDEWLFELAGHIEVVYSPIIDIKEYPEDVDVVLIEGALCNEENLELAHTIRRRTRTVISFGDCAVTANVPAMRNALGSPEIVLSRAYLELADLGPQIPKMPGILPVLLNRVMPLHEAIKVDYFLPGCPPPSARIRDLLTQLLEKKHAQLSSSQIRFG
jgi:NAD-reducing hydrogenase small subunit